MSRPRFLADNDLNEYIIAGVLRRVPSAEFVRCREVDLARRPDSEVLEYAARADLIVVSYDVNTMPASAYDRLGSGRVVTGLLVAHQDDPIAPIIDSLVLIWLSTDAEEWQGRVEFLPL